MKKLLLLAGIVILALPLFSQKANVTWGPAIESETNVYNFIAESNQHFFVLAGRKDDLYLESYKSNSFTQEFSKKLEVPKLNGKDQEIEALFFIKNKFLLFTSQYDGKANRFTSNAYQLNEKGEMNPTPTEILSVEANSRAEGGQIGFYLTGDSSHILSYHYALFRKENVQRLTMKVFDESLSAVTTATEDFPRRDGNESYYLSNVCANNDGEIYFMQAKYTPAVKKVPASTAYTIVSYGKDGKRKKDFPIDLEGKRIDRLLFSFDVKQNLLVTGFYETKSGKGLFGYMGISGTFFMSIDKETGAEKAKSFHDFDNELLESYFTPKQMAKSPKLPNQFLPRQIIQKDDGGLLCIHEQYSYSYTQSNGGATEVTYYGDLLVTNINPDGTIKWVKLVPKRQMFVQRKAAIGIGGPSASAAFMFNVKSNQTIYYSYLVAVKGDKVVLVFNDDPANQSIRPAHESEVLRKVKGSVPMMVTLTEGGELSKKPLFEAGDFDVIIRPRIALQSSDTRILIYGSKGDTDKFGVLTIE